MAQFPRLLLRLLSFGRLGGGLPPKGIIPILVFPSLPDDFVLNEIVEAGENKYYVSSPWEISSINVQQSIKWAEEWLTSALGARIRWTEVKLVNSPRSLSDWRSNGIQMVREVVANLDLPWEDDYVYLAFVRGMGGYAGGIHYNALEPGYAMVGDICLEAICDYPEPTAGSVLLGENNWPTNSYGKIGQTGAFIHEALHGLDLPHPDGWPEEFQPPWDQTIMGNWWSMPDFGSTKGLTQIEIEKVMFWVDSGN